MRVLLFDYSVAGHHLEYIHHLYQFFSQDLDDEFYFVLPANFNDEKSIYEWNNAPNIHIIAIDDNELATTNSGGSLHNSYKRVKLLRRYVKDLCPDSVFLIVLMAFMPFLLFMLPKGVKVSGIVYKIYLYRWKSSSLFKKCINVINYVLIVKSATLAKVFILNDRSAASYLNRKYHTTKFVFLTDPFNDIGYRGKDVRSEYGISPKDKVYLHFGGLAKRKGTLDIIEAIRDLPDTQVKNKVFIFAGKANKDIRDDFSLQTKELKKAGRNVVVIDHYCSNELLNDLCASSNYILCPYKETDLSSGLLSYSALYKIPVIGPKDGLIGKLIRRYHLGMGLESITTKSISQAICYPDCVQGSNRFFLYFSLLSIKSFCDIIMINVKE